MLDIPVASSVDIRQVPLLGYIESIIICSAKGLSLNSSLGGWRCEYSPTFDISKVVETITKPILYSPTPSLSQKICQLLDNEVDFIKNIYTTSK